MARPVTNATTQLAPLLTTSSTASDAGAAPRSPCAKLRIRLRAVDEREAERQERARDHRAARPGRRCRPEGPTAPGRARGTRPQSRPMPRPLARPGRAPGGHGCVVSRPGPSDQVWARRARTLRVMGIWTSAWFGARLVGVVFAVVIVALAGAAACGATSQRVRRADRPGRRRSSSVRLPGRLPAGGGDRMLARRQHQGGQGDRRLRARTSRCRRRRAAAAERAPPISATTPAPSATKSTCSAPTRRPATRSALYAKSSIVGCLETPAREAPAEDPTPRGPSR